MAAGAPATLPPTEILCTLVRGEKLANVEIGKEDPYVVASVVYGEDMTVDRVQGSATGKTHQDAGKNPDFKNEVLSIKLAGSATPGTKIWLKLQVMDKNRRRDTDMGHGFYELSQLNANIVIPVQVALTLKGKRAGILHLTIVKRCPLAGGAPPAASAPMAGGYPSHSAPMPGYPGAPAPGTPPGYPGGPPAGYPGTPPAGAPPAGYPGHSAPMPGYPGAPPAGAPPAGYPGHSAPMPGYPGAPPAGAPPAGYPGHSAPMPGYPGGPAPGTPPAGYPGGPPAGYPGGPPAGYPGGAPAGYPGAPAPGFPPAGYGAPPAGAPPGAYAYRPGMPVPGYAAPAPAPAATAFAGQYAAPAGIAGITQPGSGPPQQQYYQR